MADFERHRTVLLLHELPDGSHHFDWMLATDAGGPLLTFRLDRDISRDLQPFTGQRLDDHRRAYLTYEGPVSGDRGSVSRVAGGWCQILSNGPDLCVRVSMGVRCQKLRGIHQGPAGLRSDSEQNWFRFWIDFD